MSIRINGVHHIAISTADIKAQIEFFSGVLGARLVALFWMHDVPGGRHAFCELSEDTSVSFVQLPKNAEAPSTIGVTHAGSGRGHSAPGTTQHIAFSVDTFEELRGMRDRIRAHGVNVIGEIEHGICQSIYFAGPEGLVLEVASSQGAIDPHLWIDPEVVEQAGISEDELAAFCAPAAFESQGGSIPQPPFDPSKPHLDYPPEDYKKILAIADADLTAMSSFAKPPIDTSLPPYLRTGSAHSPDVSIEREQPDEDM